MTEDDHLHRLCNQGKYKEVEEFIQTFKADLPLRLASRRGEFGYTPLHEAVNSGHSKLLNLLLENGGDPNCCASSGCTPLHLAASSGHVDCIRVLLASNADISITNDDGVTPIQIAELNSKHYIRILLSDSGEYFLNFNFEYHNINKYVHMFLHFSCDLFDIYRMHFLFY